MEHTDSKNKGKIRKYVSMPRRGVSHWKGREKQAWGVRIQQVKRGLSS